MTNVIEVKNVRNIVTGKSGTLYLIGSVDAEEYKYGFSEHYGLSLFFKPFNREDIIHVKSLVLTDTEKRALSRGMITIIRDICKILDVQDTTLQIINLTGYSTDLKEDMWQEERIARTIFTLETNPEGLEKIGEEQESDHRYQKCGFRNAVSKALRDHINITEDTIVPHVFPKEYELHSLNYFLNWDKE